MGWILTTIRTPAKEKDPEKKRKEKEEPKSRMVSIYHPDILEGRMGRMLTIWYGPAKMQDPEKKKEVEAAA